MKRIAAAVLLVASLASAHVHAYGDMGHRVIGAIADRLVAGSKAQKQLDALFKPGENLEQLTLWADCAKGSFCGPLTEEMGAFVAANPKHSEYHYTNSPLQLTAYQAGGAGTSEHDIVQMLIQSIAVLQGRDDAQSNPRKLTRRQALLLVAHLVGDIHQPLHVGSVYMDKNNQFVQPKSQAEVDGVNVFNLRGNNDLLFADPAFDRPSYPGQPVRPQNLHFFWDITAVEQAFLRNKVKTVAEFADKAIAEKAAVALNPGPVAHWPMQWAADALAVSKKVHEGVTPVGSKTNVGRRGETYTTWTVNVPAGYADMSGALATTQMVRGGVHLAALLKAIWPD